MLEHLDRDHPVKSLLGGEVVHDVSLKRLKSAIEQHMPEPGRPRAFKH
jgi:hypothetical protein